MIEIETRFTQHLCNVAYVFIQIKRIAYMAAQENHIFVNRFEKKFCSLICRHTPAKC